MVVSSNEEGIIQPPRTMLNDDPNDIPQMGEAEGQSKKKPKKKIDLYDLKEKELGEDIIEFTDLSKIYKLPGRD
jgi:hypothetical protein